ncbi:aryl-sulfate sulfotransferase [Bacteroidota bacterium]
MKPSFCFISLFLIQMMTTYISSTLSQQSPVKDFEYVSPLPNSGYVSPYTNIIVRQGEIIEENTIKNNSINVTGSSSGAHTGKLFLTDDKKTIIFNPINSFTEGETVTVKLKKGIKTFSGIEVGMLSFNFHISKSWAKNLNENSTKEVLCDFNIPDNRNQLITKKQFSHISSSITDTLPVDLPNVYVTISNTPTDGYIFIAPWFFQGSFFDPNYLMIVDNYGTPIYYKKNPVLALDFKVQQNGILTYHNQGLNAFIGMDSSYNVVDTFRCGNGYPTDFHDIQLLDNGHYLIMGQDYQTIRMDTVVAGGDTAATVIGQIIQEKDENRNVVFQWRSWDHFLITDASDNIDLTAHTIDYVHGNSIEPDIDGNIIISCRHMNEVTKINRSTGEIIWRMGGKNNQFQFLNDPRGFTYQHDVRRLENGNLTIFDNGSLSTPCYSSSLEYIVNEVDTTLTLIWNYSDNYHFSFAMGNSQRLDNGRTFIGWGNSFNPAANEVECDGTKTFEIRFDSLFYSYRAFRFPWRTNLLTANSYIIDFEYIPVNTSEKKALVITNNSDEVLQLTSYYSRSSMFSVADNFPIILQPYQNRILKIQFFPDSVGVFSDDIHLRMQKDNEMIAQVIEVLGYSDPNSEVEIEENYLNKYELMQNYPNPFNPSTTIKYQIPEMRFVTLKVYDVLGSEIATLVNEEKPAGSYEIEFNSHSGHVRNLPSGIYFYQLRVYPAEGGAGDPSTGSGQVYVETKKMVLMK